jgi:hypothetical protein
MSRTLASPSLKIIDENDPIPECITFDKHKISSAIRKLAIAKHQDNIKKDTNRKRKGNNIYDINIFKNRKNMKNESLNRYTETITITYAVKTTGEDIGQIINEPK